MKHPRGVPDRRGEEVLRVELILSVPRNKPTELQLLRTVPVHHLSPRAVLPGLLDHCHIFRTGLH